MFLDRLFRPRPAKAAGGELYLQAAAQARRSALYLAMHVPDTREGRFELYTLHVILLVERLKGQGEQAAETSQAVFDAYVRGLDDAFRELGVGDMSVGKKVKKLGQAFYGRLRAYDAAFATLPCRKELEAVIGRTIGDGADAVALADYVLGARDHLAAQPLDQLLSGSVTWPALS
ncbi:MAG: ubiquinol-cytochrome C chaperone family protein [Parcubacteria group bacterium]